jgi:hypothetical protein
MTCSIVGVVVAAMEGGSVGKGSMTGLGELLVEQLTIFKQIIRITRLSRILLIGLLPMLRG